MKDKFDQRTEDAFGIAKLRGRPVISTPEMKRKQSANRSRRYRTRQRIINQIARSLAACPDMNSDAYMHFLNYLGNSKVDRECEICYESDTGNLGFQKILFSELTEKYFQYKDVAIVTCD